MFNTRFIYIAFFVVIFRNVLCITEDQRAQIQAKFIEVGTECIREFPLTVDDVNSFKHKVFPDGTNAGCFSACVFNKVGLLDDKGTLSHTTALENAKKVFENEEELKSLEDLLNTCAKVNDEEVSDGEKGCERAKLAFNCFAKNYEQFGFNIDF